MEVRKIKPEDYYSVNNLIEQVSRKFIFHEFTKEGQKKYLKSVTGVGLINNLKKGIEYWVAQLDDQVVGVIAFKNVSHLYNLFVAEAYHHKGIAKTLWNTATKDHRVKVYTVFSSSYAIPVYEKLGFQKTNKPFNEEGIFCIPMEKEV